MEIIQFLKNYFAAEGDTHSADDYAAFCDWVYDKRQFDDGITSKVFANVKLKKAMAKAVVNNLLTGGGLDWPYIRHSMDVRLRLLLKYYLSVAVLNDNSLPKDKVERAVKICANEPDKVHVTVGSYLNGWSIIDDSTEAIVRMRPGDGFYDGYRFFVVNMLCFTVSRFVIGMRTDSGPDPEMKYYKGCRPLGMGTDNDGIEWNLIECDTALSDDFLAIFSNQLDGDGTIEMCDWLSPSQRRIIFRIGY